MAINYYKVLNLAQNVSDQEIRKAYLKLSLKYHPDKNSQNGTEERFKLILEAYQELKDPMKRANFDYKLKIYEKHCTKVVFR